MGCGEVIKFLKNDPQLKQRRRELRRNQTDAEKVFWSQVRNRQFNGMRFFRQYSLGPYILDFYCPTVKLAVELDRGQHNQSKNREYDTFRSEYLKAHGIEVIRFWDNEVLLDIQGVLNKLFLKVTPLSSPLRLRGEIGGLYKGEGQRCSPQKCRKNQKNNGFTLLELIIVLSLITLILGLSTIFFANILPSSRFNATIRDMSATIKHARSLAQINGERQIITIDLDSRKYGLEGRGTKDIPSDIYIKVIDPLSGEIHKGKYQLILDAMGGVEGGTIVLWNNKRVVSIQMDPIVGSVVIK